MNSADLLKSLHLWISQQDCEIQDVIIALEDAQQQMEKLQCTDLILNRFYVEQRA